MKYRVSVSQGKHGHHRWQIVDRVTGKAKALSLVSETYETHGLAMRAGLEFVRGMQKPCRCNQFLLAGLVVGAALGILLCRVGGMG